MPRPKQRTPALRDQVVQVALTTLADGGVPGFTTRRVADAASTSIPAVYELFGDKAGLVREVFFDGFRQLGARFAALAEADTNDPRADLERLMAAFRAFARENRVLTEVMFSRPFAEFDPGPEEVKAGTAARHEVVKRVRRAIEAGALTGDATDIAHVLVALAQGLAAQESAGWLGTSTASRDRRWNVAVAAVLDGFGPPARRPRRAR